MFGLRRGAQSFAVCLRGTLACQIVLLAGFSLFVCRTVSFGQTRAEVSGTVTDPSGGVIPGAQITVTNLNTGVDTKTTTNQEGFYTVPLLQPGNYNILARKEGFSAVTHSGIALETGIRTTVDVRLLLKTTVETTTVTAEVPLLEEESSSVGQFIERTTVMNMPLSSRRSSSLVRLSGYVVGAGGSFFSVAGGRSRNMNWMLDGTTIQRNAIDNQQIDLDPPAESLQEFKIETNNYSSEYGRSGGGFIAMTTRSGTNQFHGAGYDFLRNDKLDTRTFFSPSKAPLHYNIFGASIGGPVVKGKTFFFFNYEGSRTRTGVTSASSVVPNPPEVQGDFSNRTDLVLKDPLTGSQFSGNIIPPSRMDPIGKAIAKLYPAPNAPFKTNLAPSANYIAVVSDKSSTGFYTAKIDHDFSQSNRLSVRFVFDSIPTVAASLWPADLAFADARWRPGLTRYTDTSGSWIHQFSPSFLNDFRFSRDTKYFFTQAGGTGSGENGKLGLSGVDPTMMAIINVTGLTTLGSVGYRQQEPVDTYHLVNNVTRIAGRHNLKTGFEYRYSELGSTSKEDVNGNFSFSDRTTGSGLADLLLGRVNSANYSKVGAILARRDIYGAFIQDDWKLGRTFTLNIGLRWELETPQWDKNNHESGFDLNAINPVCNCRGTVIFAGLNGLGKYLNYKFDKNNFGPRFGFAWQTWKGAVVRGGYGIHYNSLYQSGMGGDIGGAFNNSGSFSSPDGGLTPAFVLTSGLPIVPAGEAYTSAYGAVALGASPRFSPSFIEPNAVVGYDQQWNFGIQKTLPDNMLLDVAYLGNVGHHISGDASEFNVIPLVDGRGPAKQLQSLRPFPQFNSVTHVFPSWGNSSYHAMNVKVEKRYAHGLNFLMNYTWSKFLDDTEAKSELGGTGLGAAITHPQLRALDKSYSGNDIRHRYVASAVYELPFGHGRHWDVSNRVMNQIVGGWDTGLITELRSGMPYGVREQTNLTNTYSTAVRPNLLRDPQLSSDRSTAAKVQQWFDVTAFQAPGVGVFGNAPRTLRGGPGYIDIDVSVHKLWNLTERFNLMFRGDIYNLPNHPNFGRPDTSRGGGSFGRITGIVGTGRQSQLSLRLAF